MADLKQDAARARHDAVMLRELQAHDGWVVFVRHCQRLMDEAWSAVLRCPLDQMGEKRGRYLGMNELLALPQQVQSQADALTETERARG